jgi:3'(2'), 5'-bisphosphate nucleotidase
MNERARLEAILDVMIEAAKRAGEHVMPLYLDGCTQSKKADGSIVTLADTQAETLITDVLQAAFPTVAVLGEEATAAGAAPDLGDAYFCVDPIDGTQQFAKGDPEWVVAIGYLEKGRPVAGVIYAPALHKRMFAALTDYGGYEILPDKSLKPFPKDLPVPARWRAMQGAYGKPVAIERYLPQGQELEIIKIGSAIKFALIAAGEADVFVRPGQVWDWDIAAGQALIEAAGGKICDMSGNPLVYGQAKTNYRHPPFIARCAGLDL